MDGYVFNTNQFMPPWYIYGPVFVLVAAIRAAEHEENGKPTGAATSGGIYMGNDTTANNK
jgi:hypothetical protein